MLKNNKRTTLSNIFKKAWYFVKTIGCSLSEALKQAWAYFKLIFKMKKSIVHFYFRKINGEIREAYGTLQNVDYQVSNDNRMKNPTIQVYYDTEKQDFRCFKIFNLIIS